MTDRWKPTAFTYASTWPVTAILCGLAALVLYTLRDVLVTGNEVLPGRDSVNLYVWEIYTRSVLAIGQLPFWNPFHFAGTPHLADVQTTVLYPPAFLLRWLPPEAFLSWMATLHLWIAGAGVLMLARAIGLGWLASAAAAVAGMLGGSAAARVHNGHLLLLYCAAWFPWTFGLAIVSVRRASIWPHPVLVVVLVLQFLAGYLQGSLYLVGAVCLYYLYCAVWPESGSDRLARVRTLAQLVVLGTLALGVAAFQLLPTVRLLVQAARWSGIPYEEAIEGSWSLHRFVTFFFPFYGLASDTPHRELAEASAYVSLFLIATVPLAFLDRDRRRIAVFLAIVAATALAIVSADLPLYRLHHAIFPGFRSPGRVLFLATLSLAVLGGIGLQRFVALASAHRWRDMALGLAPSAVAIGAAVAVTVWDGSGSRPPAPAWPWLATLAGVGLVVVGVLASRARTASALAVGLALVAVDIAAFTSGAPAPVSVESVARVRSWMGVADQGRAISICENRIGAGEMLRTGQAALDGLAGIIIADYADWAHVVTSGNPLPNDGQFHGVDSEGTFPVRRDLLDAANVSTIFACAPLEAPSLVLVSHVDGIYAYRNESARPRAFWTCDGQMMTKTAATARILSSRFDRQGRLEPRAYINVRWAPEIAADGRRSLEQRHRLKEGVALDDRTWRYTLEDPSVPTVMALVQDVSVEDTHGVDRGTGLVTQAAAPTEKEDQAAGGEMLTGTKPCPTSGTVEISVPNQLDGRLLADVDAPLPGYVFLSEPFYRERKAFLDGKAVNAFKANMAFTAVAVPAGSHRLELRYVADTFRLGLGISALTLVVWGGLSARSNRRR